MMIIDAALRAYLMTVEPITDLANSQIYGIIRPQGERPLPELLITRTSTRRQKLFCATSKLVNADFQIDCYGLDSQSSQALAQATRQALIDFTGTMGDCYVDQVTLENEFVVTDSDPGFIRVMQLYTLWYLED